MTRSIEWLALGLCLLALWALWQDGQIHLFPHAVNLDFQDLRR